MVFFVVCMFFWLFALIFGVSINKTSKISLNKAILYKTGVSRGSMALLSRVLVISGQFRAFSSPPSPRVRGNNMA